MEILDLIRISSSVSSETKFSSVKKYLSDLSQSILNINSSPTFYDETRMTEHEKILSTEKKLQTSCFLMIPSVWIFLSHLKESVDSYRKKSVAIDDINIESSRSVSFYALHHEPECAFLLVVAGITKTKFKLFIIYCVRWMMTRFF